MDAIVRVLTVASAIEYASLTCIAPLA